MQVYKKQYWSTLPTAEILSGKKARAFLVCGYPTYKPENSCRTIVARTYVKENAEKEKRNH